MTVASEAPALQHGRVPVPNPPGASAAEQRVLNTVRTAQELDDAAWKHVDALTASLPQQGVADNAGPGFDIRSLFPLARTGAGLSKSAGGAATGDSKQPPPATTAAMQWPVPAAMPPPVTMTASIPPSLNMSPGDMASVLTGHSLGGTDLKLVDQYLSLLTGEQPGIEDTEGEEEGTTNSQRTLTYRNLKKLGLDRRSLEIHGVPDHYISRLHHLLYVNALAFSKGMAEEQKRMSLLLAQRDGVPLPDRLLAYMIGDQQGSPMDDLAQPATAGPQSPSALPGRWQGVDVCESGDMRVLDMQPGLTPNKDTTVVRVADGDVFKPPDDSMPIEEIITLATVGNTAGLRRLLGRYRAMHAAVRTHMEGRLSHEAQRAQRLQDKLDAANNQLTDAVKEAESCRGSMRAAEAELRLAEQALASEREVTLAERVVNEALRNEIAQLEASWSAQQAEAAARVTEQLEALHAQSEGQLDLREQYLQRTREVVLLQLKYDHEIRKGIRQSAEVEAARQAADSANAQLQVLQSWRGRVEARAAAAEGLAAACRAAVAEIKKRLDKEETAHKRTLEQARRLQHQIEQARCAATDIYARASTKIRSVAADNRDKAAAMHRLERQLQESRDILKIRQFEVDAAKAQSKAAQLHADKCLDDMKKEQDSRIQTELHNGHLKDQILGLNQTISQLEINLSALEGKLGIQLDLSAQQAAELEALQDFKSAKEQYESDMVTLAADKQRIQDDLTALQAAHQETLTQLEALSSAQVDLNKSRDQITTLTDEIKRLQEDLALLTQERDAAREETAHRAQELATTNALLNTTRASLDEQRGALNKLLDSENTRREEVTRMHKQIVSLTDELESEKERTQTLQQEVVELTKLHGVIQGLKRDLSAALERARIAEAAQVSALTDKTWWLQARQHLEAGLEEMTSSTRSELTEIRNMETKVQAGLQRLQTLMLSLPAPPAPLAPADDVAASAVSAARDAAAAARPTVLGYGRATSIAGIAPDHTDDSAPDEAAQDSSTHESPHNAQLSAQGHHLLREVASDLSFLTQRLTTLATRQADTRDTLVNQLQALDHRSASAKATTADTWSQALETVKTDPTLASDLTKHSTHTQQHTPEPSNSQASLHSPPSFSFGPASRQSDRQPASQTYSSTQAGGRTGTQQAGGATQGAMSSPYAALSGLVPAHVYEEQSQELVGLRGQLGEFQGAKSAAEAHTQAVQDTLHRERQAADERQQHWTHLVAQLQAQVAELQAHVAAAQGGRVLAERTTLAVSKQLLESEYQVNKALEREVTIGTANIVPLKREDKGVQTVYAELWAHAPPASPAEAARRAPTPTCVPTWSSDLGSGTAALPTLSQEASAGVAPPWPTLQPNGTYTIDHTASTIDDSNAAHLSHFYATLADAAAQMPGSARSTAPARPKSQGGIAAPRLASDAAKPTLPLTHILNREPSNSPPRSSRHTTGGVPGLPNSQGPSSPIPTQKRPARIDSAASHTTTHTTTTHKTHPHKNTPTQPSPHDSDPTRPVSAHTERLPVFARAIAGDGAAARPGSPAGGAPRPGSAGGARAAAVGGFVMGGGGRALQPWRWLEEVMPLVVAGAKTLSLQETIDVIADVYRAKASADAAASESERECPTLCDFLGDYVDHVYGQQYGPRPLQPMAIIVASVLSHQSVYEVRTFARTSGMLTPNTHLPTDTTTTHTTQPLHSPNRPSTTLETQAPTDSPRRGTHGLVTSRPDTPDSVRNGRDRLDSVSTTHAVRAAGSNNHVGSNASTSNRGASAASRRSTTDGDTHIHGRSAGSAGHGGVGGVGGVRWRRSASPERHVGALRPSTAFPSHKHYTESVKRANSNHIQTADTKQSGVSVGGMGQQGVGAQQGGFQLSRRQRLHQGPTESLSLAPVQLDAVMDDGLQSRLQSGRKSSLGGPRPTLRSSSARYHTATPAAAAATAGAGTVTAGTAATATAAAAAAAGGLAGSAAGAADSSSAASRQQLRLAAPAVTVGQLWPLAEWLAAGTGVDECMARIADVQGADDVVRFVASGAHMDHLTLDALGTPVLETMAPVLHHLAARVSQTLNLTVAPDLYLAPPHITPHKPISLLHIPHVSNAALMGHTPAAPRLADGTFGWRRRAVLVLSRRVVESFCTLPVATMPIPSGGVIGGSSKSDIGTVLAQSQSPYTAGEVVALLAAALAPLALPGGGGWRLSLHVARGGAVGAGNAGVGPGGALAVADAITAVSLAHVAPNALVPHLPVQLRVKWARVFAVLNRVDRAVQGVGDRAALLCCGNVEDVLTAVHKSLRATNVTPAPSDIAQEVARRFPQVKNAGTGDAVQLPQPLVDLDSPLMDWSTHSNEHSEDSSVLRLAHLLAWAGSRQHEATANLLST